MCFCRCCKRLVILIVLYAFVRSKKSAAVV